MSAVSHLSAAIAAAAAAKDARISEAEAAAKDAQSLNSGETTPVIGSSPTLSSLDAMLHVHGTAFATKQEEAQEEVKVAGNALGVSHKQEAKEESDVSSSEEEPLNDPQIWQTQTKSQRIAALEQQVAELHALLTQQQPQQIQPQAATSTEKTFGTAQEQLKTALNLISEKAMKKVARSARVYAKITAALDELNEAVKLKVMKEIAEELEISPKRVEKRLEKEPKKSLKAVRLALETVLSAVEAKEIVARRKEIRNSESQFYGSTVPSQEPQDEHFGFSSGDEAASSVQKRPEELVVNDEEFLRNLAAEQDLKKQSADQFRLKSKEKSDEECAIQ